MVIIHSQRMSAALRSWGNYVAGGVRTLGHRVDHIVRSAPEFVHDHRPNLAVLLHGLQGSPADLADHHRRFEATHAVYSPRIHRAGNCPVDVAAAPVLGAIARHLERHPGTATVTLVGLSNGGRIATWIEIELRATAVPVFTATLATPFLGSPLAPAFGWIATSTGWYDKDITDGLHPEVAAQSELLARFGQPLPEGAGRRRWVRFAGTDDFMVPVGSALGRHDDEAHPVERIAIDGHCHVSIAAATADAVYAFACAGT